MTDDVFREDAARLNAALRLMMVAYLYPDSFPDRATRDLERARAALETGKALGAHDKLIEALNA